MRLVPILLIALLLVSAGCLRVGPGEDLQLVCEEKSAAPRKAYGIDFLVSETRVNETVPDALRVPLLEAARQHIITPAGRAYDGFEARLRTVLPVEGGDASYHFEATGLWDAHPADTYHIVMRDVDGRIDSGTIQAPRTLLDSGWRVVNATPALAGRFTDKPYVERASWDPTTPSCVTLRIVDLADTAEVVVNLAQQRIVHVGP